MIAAVVASVHINIHPLLYCVASFIYQELSMLPL